MIGVLRFLLAILVSPFRSKARLEAYVAALRYQLIVFAAKKPGQGSADEGQGSADEWQPPLSVVRSASSRLLHM